MTTVAGHRPVLLDEVLNALAVRSGGRYLDGTFGGGGHSRAILRECAPNGHVLAVDADPDAVARGMELASRPELRGHLIIRHANFRDLATVAHQEGSAPADVIRLSRGLSSFQLDETERGFAFRLDGPLDMRFDTSSG